MNNDRLILIKDIRSFTNQLWINSADVMIKEWNLNPTEVFDDYLGWVIAHLLTTQHGLKVLNYNRKDNWHLCVFENISSGIQTYLNQSLTMQDIEMLKSFPVKIVTSGFDLYIIRQMSWQELIPVGLQWNQ